MTETFILSNERFQVL